MSEEIIMHTDVLIIGGGMAGCFAAIKAREKGLDVVLLDKGYVGSSGQTPFAGSYAVYNPEWGHDLHAWMHQVNTIGEYVNNRTWTELVFKDSYDRYRDLVSWGVEFEKDPDGEVLRRASSLGPCQAVFMEWRKFARILRSQVLKSGARIIDRLMVADLVKQDGRIAGAIGLRIENLELYTFMAKATVMSAGAGGFKAAGWPIHELTSDADVMAYRAGAEITGKEFSDPHPTSAEYPAYFGSIMKNGRPIFGKLVNAEGDELKEHGIMFLDLEFEAHAGRAPITQQSPEGSFTRIGGAASGMSVHKAEGIWPVNENCATSIPGLYAAGDSLGTMQSGAVYSSIGLALCGSSVTGARAGYGAAEYALGTETPVIDADEIKRLKDDLFKPMERTGGFSPRWVTQQLQNAMIPYYIMYIKHGDRLQATLTLVEFMRDHLVPKMTAKDTHELRLARETRNMVTNAEMRLRASLFRTESRGCHYREDYPSRDDANWLAWIKLKEENGKMRVFKEPLPEEWRPDLSTSYQERYPVRYPGEKVMEHNKLEWDGRRLNGH